MKPGCWPFVLATLVVLVIISASAGRSIEPHSSKTMTVCRIEYTGLGKQANWHLNYTYVVNTNEEGSVERVTRLEKKHPKFVNEDKILDCIKTWKLTPSGKHVVMFSIGTTAAGNAITVVDPNLNSIRLVL
jgi:hypothetical protein